MDGFLVFAHELIWTILMNIAGFFTELGRLLWGVVTSFGQYALIVKAYWPGLTPLQMALSILLLGILIAIVLLLVYKLFLSIRKRLKRRHAEVDQEDLMGEIASLNKQVAELVDEKSKILAMKVSQLGLKPGEEGEGATNGEGAEPGAGEGSRFPKLTLVDEIYATPMERDWNDAVTLPELMEGYRNFAASRMHLYYSPQTVRLFFASMAASRLIILEGISGTGKTSLPYSVSRYLENPAGLVSVQPSYRDRSELLGYFNEFTKRFNETEFLRHLYAAGYEEAPSYIVLDEMNLARIEYYFAEMLSVLEMPNEDEWLVDLVPVQWAGDPKRLSDGKLKVPNTLWFIGTANNDDSTFTITDKVYDRAMAIDLNDRADPFEAPDTAPIALRAGHLQELFRQAREEHGISAKSVERLGKLDQYLQTKFKLAIGNRISKQMEDFVPVYVACGGTEAEAVDYILQRKILKKFESLNLNFARDEIGDLITFIEKTFGKTGMAMSKTYLRKLQVMF